MSIYPSDSHEQQATITGRMNQKGRIAGYDLARALAIWGMVTVHFWIVMAYRQTQPAWLRWCLDMLDGRAAALFVILAGVGVSLRSNAFRSETGASIADESHIESAGEVAQFRRTFVRRGLFLLLAGFLNLTIWTGDILRVYGVSLFAVAWLIDAPNRRLLTAAAVFAVGFIVLMLLTDYGKEWEWETFNYRNLWTIMGGIRNLFYNGFRSVFPWTGLMLFGVWLGRQRLDDATVRRRVLIRAVAVALITEIASSLLVHYFVSHPHGIEKDLVIPLFGTISMPPLPLFLIAAGSSAVAVIAASLFIAKRWPESLPVRALVACGQMAFTWYILHIVIGLGGLQALGLEGNQTLPVAVATAALFFAVISLISLAVRTRGHRGPLEWLLRKVAS